MRATQNSGRPLGVSVADASRVLQAMDKRHLLLDLVQRGECWPEFQRRTLTLRPPFRGMNAVAEEQEGEPLWRGFLQRVGSQRWNRLQPRKGYRRAETL